jgi:hypothetical protein
MATYVPNARQQFCDANGNPVSAGSVGMYVVSTLTPKNTWQDSAQTTLNSNPVPLDSGGYAQIYGSGSYRQILKDSLGNTIWDKVVSDVASGPLSNVQGNPTLAAGLTGFPDDGSGSLQNGQINVTLSGSRTTAQIGYGINISDGQSGPPSSNGVNTAPSASYGLSVVGIRPTWNTSSITGEMDGHNIFLRQAMGDCAGILCNVGVRSGFASFAESYTFSADASGNPINGVRTQIGVVNPRDGGSFGFSAIAENSSNTAAFRAQSDGSATWTHAFEIVNSSGSVIGYIGGDGTVAMPAAITSSGPSSGIGYAAGAGGTATQATSKSTAVGPLNKACGAITMNNAALAASAVVSFTLTNSVIAVDDYLDVWVKSGNASSGTYRCWSEGNASGARTICVQNISGGSLSEALVLGFGVNKRVAA